MVPLSLHFVNFTNASLRRSFFLDGLKEGDVGALNEEEGYLLYLVLTLFLDYLQFFAGEAGAECVLVNFFCFLMKNI